MKELIQRRRSTGAEIETQFAMASKTGKQKGSQTWENGEQGGLRPFAHLLPCRLCCHRGVLQVSNLTPPGAARRSPGL